MQQLTLPHHLRNAGGAVDGRHEDEPYRHGAYAPEDLEHCGIILDSAEQHGCFSPPVIQTELFSSPPKELRLVDHFDSKTLCLGQLASCGFSGNNECRFFADGAGSVPAA